MAAVALGAVLVQAVADDLLALAVAAVNDLDDHDAILAQQPKLDHYQDEIINFLHKSVGVAQIGLDTPSPYAPTKAPEGA